MLPTSESTGYGNASTPSEPECLKPPNWFCKVVQAIHMDTRPLDHASHHTKGIPLGLAESEFYPHSHSTDFHFHILKTQSY